MTPVFLLGPTASGKHQAALLLAKELGAEIISVDSMKVYRGMDIGTAKPGRKQLARVPHHLIDICDPSATYSAGRFVRDAAGRGGESSRAGSGRSSWAGRRSTTRRTGMGCSRGRPPIRC